MKIILIIALLTLLVSFKIHKDFLILKTNKAEQYGYVDSKGAVIIPFGKYSMCFTDTFKNFAIVLKSGSGFVVIDRMENVEYNVFPFDNGPDYLKEGYFRIVKDGKIGYAGSDFSVKIKPQYGCAFPFEKGKAKVSYDCKTETDPQTHEYHTWISKNWFYIDKQGNRIKN
jgi:hypothetical protein